MRLRAAEKFGNKYGARGPTYLERQRNPKLAVQKLERLPNGVKPKVVSTVVTRPLAQSLMFEPTGEVRRLLQNGVTVQETVRTTPNGRITLMRETTASTDTWTTVRLWNQWCDNNNTTVTLQRDMQDWNGLTTTSVVNYVTWDAWLDCADRRREMANLRTPQHAQRPIANPPLIRTEAEWARIREQQLEAERRYREEAEKKAKDAKAALIRANKLLRALLSPQQVKTLDKENFFDVQSSKGRLFRIELGSHGNVYLLNEKGKKILQFCAQPNAVMPDADAMLAQKMMLETDEDAYVKIANVTRLADYRALRGAELNQYIERQAAGA